MVSYYSITSKYHNKIKLVIFKIVNINSTKIKKEQPIELHPIVCTWGEHNFIILKYSQPFHLLTLLVHGKLIKSYYSSRTEQNSDLYCRYSNTIIIQLPNIQAQLCFTH